MAHLTPYESNDMLKRLRKGEEVICPFCKKGKFLSVGDPEISHGFYCSHCKVKWNID